MFRVSIIIPVYNAEKYLRKSVMSVLNLDTVGEVLLVEDNSPDNALEVCKNLQEEFEKIKLYRHPNGENRGAGASRNLGIEKATGEFVAFLDADDWYLPHRFDAEKNLFKDPDVDGVYGATGKFFEATREYSNKYNTVRAGVLPENLLYHILTEVDNFHTNSITIRKSLFQKSGVFNTDLKLHQDTHLWYRLAFFGKLAGGIVEEPVAIRRVHDENRISGKSFASKAKFRQAVYQDFKSFDNVPKPIMKILFNRYIHSLSRDKKKVYFAYLKHFIKSPALLKYYV